MKTTIRQLLGDCMAGSNETLSDVVAYGCHHECRDPSAVIDKPMKSESDWPFSEWFTVFAWTAESVYSSDFNQETGDIYFNRAPRNPDSMRLWLFEKLNHDRP